MNVEARHSHLTEKAAEKLALPDAFRIEHIRKPRWIGYTRANEILQKLEDLLHYPRQPRMPNMLLIGKTNNGKTAIIERFLQLHPAQANIQGDSIQVPVLAIQAPPGPDEAGLYNVILGRLFERQKSSESITQKRDRVISVLGKIDLGIIVIDEIHNLLAGPNLKQRNFMNVLKYLGNELRVPIVGVGTSDALRAVQTDEQIQNRFEPEALPRWALNSEFARLLMSFERLLPLREPSDLASKATASYLMAATGGTIGELSRLLNEAAIYAITHKVERINNSVLEKCKYTPPSQRRAAADLL